MIVAHRRCAERGLEAELEAFYKRGGAARLPFASIIKSGPITGHVARTPSGLEALMRAGGR